MTCPACQAPIADQEPIAGLIICETCLASVVADTGQRATNADTLSLTASHLAALRARRAALRAVRV